MGCFLLFFACGQDQLKVDILIQNGTVYNGIDTIPNELSIGILADKIVYIGDEKDIKIKAVCIHIYYAYT